MAVSEQTPYQEFIANGTTTVFPLNFDAKEQDHLIVLVDDVEPQVGDWSFDFNTDQVTFLKAPKANSVIKIRRDTPLKRDSDYQTYNNSFRPEPVNDDFDRIWWKLQEIWLQLTLIWAALNLKVVELWAALKKETKDRIEADLAIKSWVTVLLNNIVDSGLVSAVAVTTIESIDDLHYLLKWDGRTVYVKSYHADLLIGGGTFTYKPSKALQNDGGMIINGWVRINPESINPFIFGAKGDGHYDDCPAIQKNINYLWNNGGGELFLPTPKKDYRLKSYDAKNSACLVIDKPVEGIYGNPICIRAASNNFAKRGGAI